MLTFESSQSKLYQAHAKQLFNYGTTVKARLDSKMPLVVKVMKALVKQKKLEKKAPEEKDSQGNTVNPYIFVVKCLAALFKEKFCILKAPVSISIFV